jgi:hypothetical protein
VPTQQQIVFTLKDWLFSGHARPDDEAAWKCGEFVQHQNEYECDLAKMVL